MIAPTAIINGLGQSIGMDVIKVEGATGDYHSDYSKKIEAAVENFYNIEQKGIFFVIHNKKKLISILLYIALMMLFLFCTCFVNYFNIQIYV